MKWNGTKEFMRFSPQEVSQENPPSKSLFSSNSIYRVGSALHEQRKGAKENPHVAKVFLLVSTGI